MKRLALALLMILLLTAVFQPATAAAAGPLRLAVAASFVQPAEEIGRIFTKKTGTEVQTTISSTGRLYAQITSGAPFDVFMAAEADRPEQLYRAGLAEEPVTYAVGRVVLWTADQERCRSVDWLSAIKTGGAQRIAIADPAVAPYGAAAMTALERAEVAAAVRGRLVFAHNVGQAFQYATIKACDLAFVALSNALSEPGRKSCYWELDTAPPVVHKACIVKNSSNRAAAAAFLAVLAGRDAAEILAAYGYAQE